MSTEEKSGGKLKTRAERWHKDLRK